MNLNELKKLSGLQLTESILDDADLETDAPSIDPKLAREQVRKICPNAKAFKNKHTSEIAIFNGKDALSDWHPNAADAWVGAYNHDSVISEAYGVNKARPFTDDPDYQRRFDKIKNMGNTEAMELVWGWIHSGNMSFGEFYKLVADYWTHKPPVHKVDYKDDDILF